MAFDKPKAVVGGAEFGVVSTVIAVVAVSGIIVKGEWCVWCVVARVEVVTADTAGVVHNVIVDTAAAMIVVVGGTTVIAGPGIAIGVSVVAAVKAAVAVVTQ